MEHVSAWSNGNFLTIIDELFEETDGTAPCGSLEFQLALDIMKRAKNILGG